MIIRKIFGDKSHYLNELKSICFSPSVVIGNRGDNTSVYMRAFNSGKITFINLLNVMGESIELDSKITKTSDVK